MPDSVAIVARLCPSVGGSPCVATAGSEPRPARHVAGLSLAELTAPESVGQEVLIVLDQGRSDRPVVLGWMAPPPARPGDDVSAATTHDAVIDGRRITISAEREILLRCGKGSIRIREDGRIEIRGTDLVSRSSGVNKIKGGAVRIN